jgi:hypothetical protein
LDAREADQVVGWRKIKDRSTAANWLKFVAGNEAIFIRVNRVWIHEEADDIG